MRGWWNGQSYTRIEDDVTEECVLFLDNVFQGTIVDRETDDILWTGRDDGRVSVWGCTRSSVSYPRPPYEE